MNIDTTQISIEPLISEKSLTHVKQHNGYTFKVSERATKKQLATLISKQFEVTVLRVRVMRRGEKIIRTGKKRVSKRLNAQKKAVVYLKKGDTIKLFEVT